MTARSRKLIGTIVFLLGLAVETWTMPHYVAPATGLIYLVLLQCMRHLRLWRWRGQPIGVGLVRAIPAVACAMIVLRVAAVAAHAQIEPAWPRGNLDRAQIARQLQAIPGRHLVIVRYGPHHDVDWEWVYNQADIDHAKLVREIVADIGYTGSELGFSAESVRVFLALHSQSGGGLL
jgi:hypothetical protein